MWYVRFIHFFCSRRAGNNHALHIPSTIYLVLPENNPVFHFLQPTTCTSCTYTISKKDTGHDPFVWYSALAVFRELVLNSLWIFLRCFFAGSASAAYYSTPAEEQADTYGSYTNSPFIRNTWHAHAPITDQHLKSRALDTKNWPQHSTVKSILHIKRAWIICIFIYINATLLVGG